MRIDSANYAVVIVLGLASTASLGGRASAQGSSYGTLIGVVRDTAGALVEKAEVEVTGPSLIGGPRHVQTDGSGSYRIWTLPAGPYNVTVRLHGFKDGRYSGVELTAGMTLTADFILQPSAFTETVTVEGAASQIDVTNPAFVSRIDMDALQNLPRPRGVADLINLAPGVTRSTGLGGTINSNAIYVDGVDVTEPRTQSSWVDVPYLWSSNYSVLAAGADVDSGEFTGISANAELRSGANQLFGMADWWIVRPSWLDNNVSTATPRRLDTWWQLNAQVGGPLQRDRLWYFAGLDFHRLVDRPAGFEGPGARTDSTPRSIGRMTMALRPLTRLEGFLSYGEVRQDLADVGQITRQEVASDVRQRDTLWNSRLLAVNGTRLLEVTYGGYLSSRSTSPHPPNTRDGPAPQLDFALGLTGNARAFSDREPRQQQLRAVLTRSSGPGGSHELKAGAEYEWSNSTERRGIPTGIEYRFENGAPLNTFSWAGESTTASGNRAAFWARDQWRVVSGLTLTAGVRVDVNRGSVPDRGVVFKTSPVSPRLGLVWDVGTKHRTAIKAHYGRYADSLLLNRIAFLDTAGQHPQIFSVPDGNGGFLETLRVTPTVSNRLIDDDISHSYVDQFVTGIEHVVARDLTAQAMYSRRHFDNFMALVDMTSQWEQVERSDPGPDGRPGTSDDGGTVHPYRLLNFGNETYLYTNPDGAFRRYDALQFVATKRYRNRWQLQGSFTWATTDGTIGNGDFSNAGLNDTGNVQGTFSPGVFLSPNGQINARGTAALTFTEAKVFGTWHAPWFGGFMVSGIFRAYSGYRWERFVSFTNLGVPGEVTVRAEPRGTRSLPAVKNLDLRVSKDLPLPRVKGRLSIYADVYNVTNQGTAQFAFGRSGGSFGTLGAFPDPRLLRAALRFTF